MANSLGRIDHVVVLMLENRSFDHMLGFTKSAGMPVDGLSGDESNPDAELPPGRVFVTNDADYLDDLVFDAAHGIEDVALQLYGSRASSFDSDDGRNDGFVVDYGSLPLVDAKQARRVMACFAPARLPVLTRLAREFAVCDRWHASVPSSTWPNRLFVHAATSYGEATNALREYPMKTIYDSLDEAACSWNVYFHDVPVCLLLERLRSERGKSRLHRFEQFKEDAATGKLPSYSFIEPRYLNFLWWRANDQHPNHDVRLGELLIADVYEALRASPAWERTLLVVVYDEHGGTYDHVFPPTAVSPDGRAYVGPDFAFGFNRLGVRVPAVLVSPWIAAGTVDHTLYDHTSILATVRERFGLASPLTARDAAAASFGANLSLDAPRKDTPTKLERPSVVATWLRELEREMSPEHIALAIEGGASSLMRLTGHQQGLVDLVNSLDLAETPEERATAQAHPCAHEHAAASHVRDRMAKYLGR